MAKRKQTVKAKTSTPKVLATPKVSLPKVDRKKIVTGLIVIAVLVLLYLFKGLFVAAMVNGRPITRFAVISELEKQDGGSVLQSLVTKELINEEAKKSSVVVTKEQIDAEIAKIEDSIKAQGQTLDEALATQGWTRTDLENQIRTQLIVEAILADKVTVAEQEIDDYIKANKSTEPRESISQLLRQQKLMTEYQTWIQELLAKAKVNYWVNY